MIFFRPAVLALEKPGSPDAKQLEGVPHIVVGRAIVRRQVPFIQVAGVSRGIGVRTGIEGMAKAVLRVDRKRPAELVLQLDEKRVEVGRPVIRVVVDAGNVRIESIAVSGAHVVKVVLLRQMASGASLIADGSDPLAAQLPLHSQGVVVGSGRRPVRRQRRQLGSAGGGQVVRTEGHDTGRIGGVSVGVMNIRREAVDVEDVAPGKRGLILHKGRIETDIESVGLCDAVVSDSEAAAHYGAAAQIDSQQRSGCPGKA